MQLDLFPHRTGYVYFAHCGSSLYPVGYLKIGFAADPHTRLLLIRNGKEVRSPKDIRLHQMEALGFIPGSRRTERSWHKKFSHLRVEGEWFKFEGDLKIAVLGLEKHEAHLTGNQEVVRSIKLEKKSIQSPGEHGKTKYLSPNKVADTLDVTRRTVYNWVRSGELPATKIGRTWRVTQEDLDSKRKK